MSRAITMTFPNDVGVDEAKRRITAQCEKVKREYVDRIGRADLGWVGDTAHIHVGALGQTVEATIAVGAQEIKVEVQLPWLLSAMAGKIQGLIQRNAEETLRIGTTRKA